jgi:hypothetical protein
MQNEAEPTNKKQIRQLKLYFRRLSLVVPAISGVLGFSIGGGMCFVLYLFSILNRTQLILGVIFWTAGGLSLAVPFLIYKARAVKLLIKELERNDQVQP